MLPPGDNGERLRAKVTRKVVEDIEKADGERVQKLIYILVIGNDEVEVLISYNQRVDHLEAAANDDNGINDDLVGSSQVSFLTCTLEIPQKITVQVICS